MTGWQLLDRLEKIKDKDRRNQVYFQLLNFSVEQIVDMIEKVDDILFEEQIDQSIREFKQMLKDKGHIKS